MMKAQVIGVKRLTGTSKKSGQPYDFAKIFILTAVRPGGPVRGAGYEQQEVDLAPEAQSQFEGLSFPCALDLETESRPFGGQLVTVVTGVKAAAGRAAS